MVVFAVASFQTQVFTQKGFCCASESGWGSFAITLKPKYQVQTWLFFSEETTSTTVGCGIHKRRRITRRRWRPSITRLRTILSPQMEFSSRIFRLQWVGQQWTDSPSFSFTICYSIYIVKCRFGTRAGVEYATPEKEEDNSYFSRQGPDTGECAMQYRCETAVQEEGGKLC